MMHKAVLTCKLEAYRFERQMKPFHYFPSCFGNSMSDFWWSHSAALEEVCSSCRHKPLAHASVSAHNCLVELRVSEWKHGIWSHWHQVMHGLIQDINPWLRLPQRFIYCFQLSWCHWDIHIVKPFHTAQMSVARLRAWDYGNHQLSCSEFYPMTIMSSPFPWTRWHLNPEEQLWCITKVDHTQLPLVYHVSTKKGHQVPSCTW